MNKNSLIQLALNSPKTPDLVDPFDVSQLFQKRINSIIFAMYFEKVSGLDFKDVKYTIKNGEYPWHIQEEQANKTYEKLKSQNLI